MAIDRQYRLESHAKARVIFLASHAFVRLIASSYQKLSKLSEDIAETLEVIPHVWQYLRANYLSVPDLKRVE